MIWLNGVRCVVFRALKIGIIIIWFEMENRMNEQFFFWLDFRFLFIHCHKKWETTQWKFKWWITLVQLLKQAQRIEYYCQLKSEIQKFHINSTSALWCLTEPAQKWTRKRCWFRTWWWSSTEKKLLKWKCELNKNRHDIIWLIGIPWYGNRRHRLLYGWIYLWFLFSFHFPCSRIW